MMDNCDAPFESGKILAIDTLSACPVHLACSEVDLASCENCLLHHPCSCIEERIAIVPIEVIYVGADIELLIRIILNAYVFGLVLSLKKTRV